MTIGTLAGAIAGYYGGVVDRVIMRFVDAVLSFPTIVLLLDLAAFVRPNLLTITLIIDVTAWIGGGPHRPQPGPVATRARIYPGGPRHGRDELAHHGPRAVAQRDGADRRGGHENIADAILLESYISFLGYGIQPPVASWGNMLNNAQSYFDTAAWRSSPGS